MRAESNQNGGFGLASMRERVERLGGALDLRSTQGKGMTVLMRLHPMEVSHE